MADVIDISQRRSKPKSPEPKKAAKKEVYSFLLKMAAGAVAVLGLLRLAFWLFAPGPEFSGALLFIITGLLAVNVAIAIQHSRAIMFKHGLISLDSFLGLD